MHTNECEDFYVSAPLNEQHHVLAVMDGCSMGTESIFAAMLIGKVLRAIAKTHFYSNFRQPTETTTEELLKTTTSELFQQLKTLQASLHLDRYELLSTLVLAVVNSGEKRAEVLVVGDGVVAHNERITQFEQNNQPDYLGYHLSEPFDRWYLEQKQRLSLENLHNLGLATDGVYTFRAAPGAPALNEAYVLERLLLQRPPAGQGNYLDLQLRELREEHRHVNADDVAVIRALLS